MSKEYNLRCLKFAINFSYKKLVYIVGLMNFMVLDVEMKNATVVNWKEGAPSNVVTSSQKMTIYRFYTY